MRTTTEQTRLSSIWKISHNFGKGKFESEPHTYLLAQTVSEEKKYFWDPRIAQPPKKVKII